MVFFLTPGRILNRPVSTVKICCHYSESASHLWDTGLGYSIILSSPSNPLLPVPSTAAKDVVIETATAKTAEAVVATAAKDAGTESVAGEASTAEAIGSVAT